MPPKPGPPGFTRSAPIRVVGRRSRVPDQREGNRVRRRSAPVDRHGERAALEAVAAVGPGDVRVERGERRPGRGGRGSGRWSSCSSASSWPVRADPGAAIDTVTTASTPITTASFRDRVMRAPRRPPAGTRRPRARARRRTNRARARSARRRPVPRRCDASRASTRARVRRESTSSSVRAISWRAA